jgi:hypothetical protein
MTWVKNPVRRHDHAAAVHRDGNQLVAEAPMPLFKEPSLRVSNEPFFSGGAANYAVSEDGERLLVNRLVKEPGLGPPQVVLNAIK